MRSISLALCPLLSLAAGCAQIVQQTDQDVAALIRARQREVLGAAAPADIGTPRELPRPSRAAYARSPQPVQREIPPDFVVPSTQPATTPAQPSNEQTTDPTGAVGPLPATPPALRRERVFTLTDALAYAQVHRREYQIAKEELYLAALALTLERHLWTPIFASQVRTVYGNYGEIRNFDQAMRFVADLSVAQRLPYGGEFTAQAVSTLIRDVKRTITAQEGSTLSLGLNVPLLRGAGHVAREQLIQLERELTYAVRVFERFRRWQLVDVARGYFDLLRVKQEIADGEERLARAEEDFDRARALERTGQRTPLETQRAEQAKLEAENGVENARERFRAQGDEFKLSIGMPVDEPLGREDLEDIETIERQIEAGVYPLLSRPAAVEDEPRALAVALEQRFDLRTARDRIDDARRGIAIAENALLPDLNWTGTLSFDTDPNHYNIGAFSFDRANWRTELVFGLPVERTAERVALRRALITEHAAQRSVQEQTERVRLEVRRVVNQIRLQETSLEIQRRSVKVAELQREFAQLQFEKGIIDNRDKVEAERALLNAQNALNQAKTTRWGLLLQFRLATETLRIDEDGVQEMDANLP